MKTKRVYNFSAGPAVLPEEVLKEAWPVVPSDETMEEFIGYLMDLDLRF